MNDKRFDNIIKGKLDHLSPDEGKDMWSSFESKLDITQPVQSDEQFDNKVKNQIQSHRPQFKSEHWRMMKTELITIEERKNTVFISKVLELSAIFLIVFTITQLPLHINKEQNNQEFKLYTEIQVSDKKNIPSLEKSASVALKQNAEAQSKKSGSLRNAIGSIDKDKFQKGINANKLQSTPVNEINDITSKPLVNVLLADNPDILSKTEPTSASTNQILISEQQAEPIVFNTSINDVTVMNETTSSENEIPQKKENFILSEIAERNFLMPESEIALIIPLKASVPSAAPGLGLSFWAAKDVNLINTPFDKLYSLASYKKEALSDAYGVNISKQYASIEIQTGLGYMQKEYQPKKIIDAYGEFGENYFEKSLNKISYDLVTVPFNLKYHGIRGTGWSAYLMAGAALNIVVNADYDIMETLVRGKPAAGRFLPDEARLDKKPFISGIFNGDSFKDNYYATIGFGFGIEKNIFRKTSIYIQPSYFRHILSSDIGIGPNKDKIHTSSLQVGVKTLIN